MENQNNPKDYRTKLAEARAYLLEMYLDESDKRDWATSKVQAANKRTRADNSSGIVGVHYDKKSHKWRAQISVDGTREYLGLYENIDDAKDARLQAEIKYYGGGV